MIAAITSCFMLIKIFDWMRQFKNTGFFIMLIEETLYDISHFMYLLLLTMITFGVPMVLLQLNRDEESEIIESIYDFWIIDLLLNQYMLLLGQTFGVEHFADNPQGFLCYIFFVFATFISFIMMLNSFFVTFTT